MIEPIRISIEVDCPIEHAFDVWTRRIDSWWPADHTVSGEASSVIVLEARQGGRIYERLSGGTEHTWGQVLVWEPPSRLAYSWHLKREPADATDVDIRFVARGDGATTVRIEHRGWERLGADGQDWRDRNEGGWSTLLPHFVRVAASTHRFDGASTRP